MSLICVILDWGIDWGFFECLSQDQGNLGYLTRDVAFIWASGDRSRGSGSVGEVEGVEGIEVPLVARLVS